MQFPSSIAKAWTLRDENLLSLDLFDYKNIPALSFDEEDISTDWELPDSPAIYIGWFLYNFKKMYYVVYCFFLQLYIQYLGRKKLNVVDLVIKCPLCQSNINCSIHLCSF